MINDDNEENFCPHDWETQKSAYVGLKREPLDWNFDGVFAHYLIHQTCKLCSAQQVIDERKHMTSLY
jgi:hypothetical protein